ncbi:hypothetical protein K2173_014367 [Erythroxylum novogranatense]|uniref:peroxidase n=1 Tax=Erythroxylum novogranatense TaxID=1862640 RepID=A0AAV8S5V0_9ROSI|nr:hypothetical protein K2173_014367 [Erythroxylum novogranatense]
MAASLHGIWSASCMLKFVFLFMLLNTTCQAQLSTTYYDTSCPNALNTIRTAIRRLRCSILLDESPSIQSEKTAFANDNSARGYNVIDNAKSAVERVCPGVVSCADIMAVAARDASAYVGGPSWAVKLGRRDSTTASRSLANTDLPGFGDSLETLIAMFDRKGLNARDMVALSGSHTIGQAQCFTFRDRIYSNSSNIDPGFATTAGAIVRLIVATPIWFRLIWSRLILLTTITSEILCKEEVCYNQTKSSLVGRHGQYRV